MSLVVRGGATREEIAAVAALLSARSSTPTIEDAYARWRRVRLESLRVRSIDPTSGHPER